MENFLKPAAHLITVPCAGPYTKLNGIEPRRIVLHKTSRFDDAEVAGYLVNCRFGIVILSKAFLAKKKWTEHELNGLFARHPSRVPIEERRKPQPNGMPGFLGIDTVHQGDQDGRKGLYHINAVDEVTQWEVVAATPQISEVWLLPVLEAIQCLSNRCHRVGGG